MSVRCLVCRGVVFFFQAEDGIRDLVRSRGLGDVYKRQRVLMPSVTAAIGSRLSQWNILLPFLVTFRYRFIAVSYTHLTLPTSDLV